MVHGEGPSIGFLMALVKFREFLLTALPGVHDHHAPGEPPAQLHPRSQGAGGGDALRVEAGEHGQLVTQHPVLPPHPGLEPDLAWRQMELGNMDTSGNCCSIELQKVKQRFSKISQSR